jgi:predicted phosphodiesterase
VRKLLWTGVGLGSLVLILLALAAMLNHRRVRPPFAFPYSPESAAPSTWRIGVLGDSQKALANLRNIVREVLKTDPALLLHTGDLVASNDEGHYSLAYQYLREGGVDPGQHWPFVAPGNHDVKGGSERFVAGFGPLEKSFTKFGVAIVILDNADGTPPDLRHVETRIAAAGPHQAVVLAMHQPPFDLQGNPKPSYAAFLSWLEKRKVAYLLFGHVHGYIKKKVGETTVIVNGVGGDYDAWQFDQKVYATILEVEGSRISDRRIEIEPAHEVWENIEHFAIGHVAEAYRRKPVLCWLGTLLLAGGVGWGWVRLLRRPKIPTLP